MAKKVKNMTYEQLEQAYEKAAQAYHRTRLGTEANGKAGERMDKASWALDAYCAQQKRLSGATISVYESLLLAN